MRAYFLRLPPASHSPAKRALHFVFALICFALFIWIGWKNLSVWILLGTILLLGVLVGIAIDSIRHKRELGQMAYDDWLDRCIAIGRQHDIPVPADLCSLTAGLWRNRWLGGLTPEQAVQQEKDALELEDRRG